MMGEYLETNDREDLVPAGVNMEYFYASVERGTNELLGVVVDNVGDGVSGRGEGRSGCKVGGSGGGVLVMAGTGVGIMPPGRWCFRIKMGSLEMHLSGVRGE